MNSNIAGYRNFLSDITGISISLPNDWQKGDIEDPNELYDFYFLPSEQNYGAQISLQQFAIPVDELHPYNYQEMAEALLEEQSKNDTVNILELLDQRMMEIDHYPARIDIFNYVDTELEISITQYQACIQQNHGVCAFLALVQTEYIEQYLPIFETAVKSIHFT